ncbi:MAG: hypothetical protein IT162_08970 [Bryobacterales bacterium]|nr:hypothetical protein [Bryobacterales bacterium]
MEFLIRQRDGGSLNLHAHEFEETLRPSSHASISVPGFGDHRIKVDGCEVSFSHEDPGMLVSFECSAFPGEKAEQIVAEISEKVAAATGQSTTFVRL